MFSRCSQDVFRMLWWILWAGGIWWSFQMKVWTLMVQRNSMIPNYSMIPAIRLSQLFNDPQLFDDPHLFYDTQLFDDQLEIWTLIIQKSTVIPPSLMVLYYKDIERARDVFIVFIINIDIKNFHLFWPFPFLHLTSYAQHPTTKLQLKNLVTHLRGQIWM